MVHQQDDFYQDPNIVSSEGTESYNPALLQTMGHESIRFLLNSDNILAIIKRRLDAIKVKDDLKNEILLLLEPVVSRAIYLSDLDEEHVYIISYEVNKAVIHLVFEKGDNLSYAQKKSIIALCFALVFSSLRRPYKGGERKLLSETQQSREVLQKMAGGKDQKGGWRAWFSKF